MNRTETKKGINLVVWKKFLYGYLYFL
jgi:hypothetical protein